MFEQYRLDSPAPMRRAMKPRHAASPSVLPLLAAALLLLLCSFALGHVAAPFLSLAQGLLVAGQMLLVALVLRLRAAP